MSLINEVLLSLDAQQRHGIALESAPGQGPLVGVRDEGSSGWRLLAVFSAGKWPRGRAVAPAAPSA